MGGHSSGASLPNMAEGDRCVVCDHRLSQTERAKPKGAKQIQGRTEKIQRDDAKKIVAVDRAAAVALRRLDGEADESPDESTDDECDDDEYDSNDY